MDIIEKIIEIEYRMFDKVNEGGARASCQDDKETFYAMRRCQFTAWNEAMRESYLEDLICAEEAGFNLVTEKYARMMKYTAPAEYAQIEGLLRPVTAEKEELVDQIHAISMEWSRQLHRQYPHIASGGRSLDDDETSQFGGTSISTYLRGELLTYSENTLSAYLAWQKVLLEKGENMDQAILEATVKLYGFASLAEAESYHRQ
ncbi:DUF4125 family protein [Emergencia sp.]|uniref:DUF4125 family protein n=1 Tax=Emergencia sp. TaxID=1926557 RepID=UPI003AEF17FD